MEVSVKDERVCNQATMGKRLERFGEVMIVYETTGFRQDFVEKTESGLQSTASQKGAVN